MSTLNIVDYNGRSFLLRGDTKPYKEEIKAMNGRWNRTLGAWVFSLKRKDEVTEFIRDLGTPPATPANSPTIARCFPRREPEPLSIVDDPKVLDPVEEGSDEDVTPPPPSRCWQLAMASIFTLLTGLSLAGVIFSTRATAP
jgi:hypothetical protein